MDSLRDVYIDQLKDLYSANQQSAEVTRKLAQAASDGGLRSALEAGVAGIEDGMEQIAAIAGRLGTEPEGEHCLGMAGLVKEAEKHALAEEFRDGAVRDAVIITQYQRMAHYAIASYGCLAAFAERLGLDEDRTVLHDCLEACRGGDATMTEIAKGGVNAAAT